MTGSASATGKTQGLALHGKNPAEKQLFSAMPANPRNLPDTASIAAALRHGRELLCETSECALLDSEVLLCFVLGKQRSYLRTWPEHLLLPEQQQRFLRLLLQRHAGQPIAYLTGSREFWSREFIITPDVLIPRPETELLIEHALELLPRQQALEVLDLGTGSGAIAVTLAAERPLLHITATDISPAALHIASRNARRHRTTNIRFHQSRWFEDLPAACYDLVVSNPPYIAPQDAHLQQGDLRYEPQTALVAGHGGLADIEEIIDAARRQLKTGGHLLLEHGYDQQNAVQEILRRCHYCEIRSYPDLAGLPRVSSGLWTGIPA